MRYSLSTFENAKPNQVRGSIPGPINRLIGKFGMLLVDTEAPEILSTTVDPDGVWATVNIGNPKTGQIMRQIKIPKGPRISRTMEGLNG